MEINRMEDLWISDEEGEPTPAPVITSTSNTSIFNSRGNRGGRGGYNNRQQDNNSNRRSERTSRNNYSGNGAVLSIPSSKVGRVIGRGGAKIRELQQETRARIKVGDSSSAYTNITINGSEDAQASAKQLIENLIEDQPRRESQNSAAPPRDVELRRNSPEKSSEPYVPIDWVSLNAGYEAYRAKWLAELLPITKNFYHEDPAVAAMSDVEVANFRRMNNDILVRRTFEDQNSAKIPNPVQTFEQAFSDYPEILREIYNQNFKKPSPIQCQAWPILLSGEDFIGIAQTGTGKTLAYLLPALIHIDGQNRERSQHRAPQVLILAPTRELAQQIHSEVTKYKYKDINSVCIYGGADRHEQIENVAIGVDIVIATPGRLNDLVAGKHLKVDNFSYIVLDEADRMLDLGFEPQIRKSLFEVRPDRQTVLTSATWPTVAHSRLGRLAESYAKNPIQVNVGSLDLTAVHSVQQKLKFISNDQKFDTLMDFIQNMNPKDKVIIFCGKRAVAVDVYTDFCVKHIKSQAIYGTQHQEDREQALEDMKTGEVNILFATDIVSRGIDIKDLSHVVNYDFPRNIEEYVHRIGRTGRAGKTGIALSFFSREDWANAAELIKILEEANQEVPDELREMARGFEAMKRRQAEKRKEGKRNRGRGGRGGGGFSDYC